MSYEIEQVVLGIMLQHQMALVKGLTKVDAEDFTDAYHKALYSEMRRQFEAGAPFNIALMPAELKAGDNGKYFAALAASVADISGLSHYCTCLKDATAKRRLGVVAKWLAEATASDDSSGDIAARATTEIASAFDGVHGLRKIGEVMADIDLDGLEPVAPCWATGMTKLDRALDGGFFGGRFYGFAARQKKGKSALLGSFAYNIALSGGRVAYLTLEMDTREVAQRFMARAASVRPSVFRHAANLAKYSPRLKEARDMLASRKLSLISAPRMSLDKLRLTLSGIGYGKAADVVIIDYLQLVSGQSKSQSGAEHLDNVAQTMAEMAKIHGFSVITAVQLNREDMVRGGDGLLNACDMAFKLDTSTYAKNDGTEGVEAWLEMLATRYTAYSDVGTKEQPAFDLIEDGPYYAER